MLMVIFGAGASYDSDARNPVLVDSSRSTANMAVSDRPPLAKELLATRYRRIANQYPPSIAVLDYIEQHQAGGSADSIETILAQYADRCPSSRQCRQALVAFRFYLASLLTESTSGWLRNTNGSTTYLSLLNYLLEWQEKAGEDIQLVTFNYDTLLEDAIEKVIPDWTIRSLDDYSRHPGWSLLKLHGSISWSRCGDGTGSGSSEENAVRAITCADEAYSDLSYSWVNAVRARITGEDTVYFPAIAIPMTGKTTFECEERQVAAFRAAVPNVTRLLICGWRAAEAHAVEILDQLRPGYYLGIVTAGADALQEVETNLGHAHTKGVPKIAEAAGMARFAQQLRGTLDSLLLEPW
jgi:hypothetical protein